MDTGPVDARTTDAEKLRRWLVERFTGDEIDVRTIVRLGPNTIRDASLVRSLVGVLENNGWLVRLDRQAQVRRAPVWRIVRR